MCDGFEWELKWGMTTKQLYRQNIFQLLFCFCVATILYWKWQANKERRTTTTTATNANENDGKKERMKRRKKSEREREGGGEVENKKKTLVANMSFSRCQIDDVMVYGDWIVECCIGKHITRFHHVMHPNTWPIAFV